MKHTVPVLFCGVQARPWPPSVFFHLAIFVVFSGFKCEGHTVDTEPLTCWVRSIFEHVPQVGVTLHQRYTTSQ